MAFTNRYRPDLPAGPIQDAFDALYAQLRGFVSVSFNEDGSLIPATPDVGVSPVGSIIMYGGASAPSNWLMCDGTAVSRVTYKDLFAVVGTAYGTGDGSTTFNVPDMRQRFALGKAASGTGVTLGETGGAIDHTHSFSGISISGTTSSSGSHSHSGSTSTDGSHTHSGTTDSDGTHSHSISGSTDAGNNQTDGTQSGSSNFSSDSAHTHVVSGSTSSDGSHTHGFTTGSGGSHSHSISSDGTHTHTFSGSTGVGSTGTNNPPYQVVNYLILAGV